MQATIIWLMILGSVALFAGLGILFRYRLIRRTYRDLWQLYTDEDFCPHLLDEVKQPEWPANFKLQEGRVSGKRWWVAYESEGAKRFFYLARFWDIFEEAKFRWQAEGDLFYFWHMAGQAALCAAMCLKGAIIPAPNDIRMMIGFDSIAAQRLCRQRAQEQAREGVKARS